MKGVDTMSSQLDKKILENVIGKGCRYPSMFSERSGGTAVLEGVRKINQSISDILNTRKGERVLRPEYGSDISRLLFEPSDEVLYDLLAVKIYDALDEWEPRIVVLELTIRPRSQEEREHILVEIRYRIKNSDLEEVFTYHFNPEGRDFRGR